MNRKSNILGGLMFAVGFFSALLKELKERNVSEEMIFDALKSKDDLIPQIAEKIANLVSGVREFALKYLRLIRDDIMVTVDSHTKKSFFVENGPVKLWFEDKFKEWILPAIPEIIPPFQGELVKTQLKESMHDSEILNELGQPRPYTIVEFAAIIRELLMGQPKGEGGILDVHGNVNIFYVKLEDNRIVAVDVDWDPTSYEWNLFPFDLGGGKWDTNACVLSLRSSKNLFPRPMKL